MGRGLGTGLLAGQEGSAHIGGEARRGKPCHYPEVLLHIDGAWTAAASGRTLPVIEPGDRRGDRHGRARRTRRPRPRAGGGGAGLRDVAQGARRSTAPSCMRKAADLLRERADKIAPLMTMEQGKPVGRGARARRWPAPTSSTGSPRRRGAPMAASSRRGPRASTSSSSRSRSARSRRSRRGTSRSTRRCARSSARWPPAARSSSRGRRRRRPPAPSWSARFVDAGVPAGVVQPGVRRAGGDFRVPDPASGDPQGLVHRLDAGGQAAGGAGRAAHEAGHDGAGRPRAGDRVRRRRYRRGEQDAGGRQVPQRRPGLRLARRGSWCRRACTSSSSRASSPRRRR